MCGSQNYKLKINNGKKLKLPYGETNQEHTEFDGRK